MSPAVFALPGQDSGPVAAGYAHDVFISRHQADERWVEEELLKPLQDAGLDVTGEWDFEGGEDREAAREREVRASRHTLVVLTEEWCKSHSTKDDALLIKSLDPDAANRRLLPLLLKECRPPERIARLVPYDFTRLERRAAELTKLLEELGRPREAINKVLVQSARKGLAALAELMRKDEVREAVSRVRGVLAKAVSDIGELARWKQLHDLLHGVANQFPQLVEKKNEVVKAEEAGGEEECDDRWTKLEHFVGAQMGPAIEPLVHSLRGGAFQKAQVPWLPLVEKVSTDLPLSAEVRDLKLLKRSVEVLGSVVGQQMNSVNQRLLATAERLPLDALVSHLRGVGQDLDRREFEAEAAARVEEFRRVIPALQELDTCLQALACNHNCLQTIENQLSHLDPTMVAPEELEVYWSLLEEPLGVLRADGGNTWVPDLLGKRAELDCALAACKEVGGDARAARKVRSCFITFRSKVSTGFVLLDRTLVKFCEELKKVGECLMSALREMRRD
jgi:hypothetical protein